MGEDVTQVIITSDPAKLPPAVRVMIDKGAPLAPGIAFFEEKFTAAGTARVFGLSIVLAVIGLLIGFVGIIVITSPNLGSDGVWLMLTGFVFLSCGYFMFGSLRGRRAVIRAQTAGEPTRYGLFLSNDLLISHSWFDTTVIPRSMYQGMDDRSLRYGFNGKTKSFALPNALVGADNATLDAAIRSWSTISLEAAG